MTTSGGRFARLTVVATLLALAAPARAGIVVAQGEDLSFSRPQLSNDGMRGVMARSRDVPGQTWSDVVLFDMAAGCGQDVLHELTDLRGRIRPHHRSQR